MIEISLPEDCTPDDRARAMCVRTYFDMQSARYLPIRIGSYTSGILKVWDKPKNGLCVWHKIVKAAKGKYNPLWAVAYVTESAALKNGPLTPAACADRDNAPMFFQHGAQLFRNASAKVIATKRLLTVDIAGYEYAHGVCSESALHAIAQTISLDPVMELLWKDARKIKADPLLIARARIAYSSFPGLYVSETYPSEWLGNRKLRRLFEVDANVEATMVNETAADELLVTI